MFFRLFLFCLAAWGLDAKILQTNRIEDVLAYTNGTTWVLFDLDDTLIEGENQYGRAKWYFHEIKKMVGEGLENEEAQNIFYPQWILSQLLAPTRTPETVTADVVARVQQTAQRVMALTARHPPIAPVTVEQLERLGIAFSKNAPAFAVDALPTPFSTVYRDGIWFLSDFNNKGECFAQLFDTLTDKPKRVVLVDDGRHHLEAMQKALGRKEVEFIGIHYTKAIERPFDAQIAELQVQRLPEILSDAQAACELGRS